MSLVVYKKAKLPGAEPPKKPQRKVWVSRRAPFRSRFVQVLPAVLVTAGSVLIANVLWPIVSYQLFVSPVLQPSHLNAPIEMDQNEFTQYDPGIAPVHAAESSPSPIVKQETIEPTVLNDELDYTNLAAWFPSQSVEALVHESAKTYLVSIPVLGVEKAEVRIGGLNLDKNLIQYPGTANPGEFGSPIIFGHSVSPIFYNPSIKNPRRYTSIFTKIMNLKKDDKITVEYDGITYTYRVTGKTEVKPDDTFILEQRHDIQELKLVTCTPPGTMLRRGIVFAQLEDYQ